MSTPKRPGRPRLYEVPCAAVHLKLRADDYDRVHRIARDQRESVQDVIRRGITRLLKDERGGTF